MAVIVNGDGILTGVSSLTTALDDLTSGRGTVTGVATVGTLQLGAGVSISSPRTQNAAIFTNNSEFLTVDDAGRVGVGTVTPNSDAHPQNVGKINVGFITARSVAGDIDANTMVVAGISTFTGDVSIADKIIHTGDTNTAIRFPSADSISFETGGTQRAVFGSDGKFKHESTGAVAAEFTTSNGSGAYHKYELGSSGTVIGYTGSGGQLVTGSGADDFAIRSQANLVLSSGGSTERLRIASDSNITQTIDTDGDGFIITAGDMKPMLTGNSNRSAHNNTIFGISGKWNNTEVGRIAFEAGDDTTNKDNGKIRLYTTPSGGSLTARVTITDTGNLGLGTQTPEEELTIASVNPCLRLNDTDNYHRVVSSGENLVLECDTGNQRTGSFIAFRVDGAVDRCRVTEHGLTPNPNDTAEANALQDYEEGTFVPTLADSSGNTSTFGSITSARYTKIGNTVRASFRAVNVQTTVLQGSATFYLKGLPFTTNGRNYATAWLRSFNSSNWGAQKCLVFAYVESNQVYFQGDDGTSGGATVKVEDFTHNQSDIFMTMVYETTQ